MKRGVSIFIALAVAVLVLTSADIGVAADEESLEELVTRVGRARWTYDNSLELLADPVTAWRARVELAQNARHHLLISVFSWHNDTYGKEYRRVLIDAVDQSKKEGHDLTVRVLADASALGVFSPAFKGLEDEGAKVRGFNRSSWGMTAL